MSLTSDDQWYHDLISACVSAKWMSDSKSTPQITLESITTKKYEVGKVLCVPLRTRLDSFLIPMYDFLPPESKFHFEVIWGGICLR